MKYYINYASNGFTVAQSHGLKVAEQLGFTTIGYYENDIDLEFKEKNNAILNTKRGGGYWLWKPYLIYKTLKKINYGDYLVYMDSGAMFIRDPSQMLNLIDHRGLLSFMMIQKTSKWTKGDCFHLTNGDDKDQYKDLNQVNATYIFFRKTDFVMKFVEEWLEISQNNNAISDEPNVYKDNFEDFSDHRHDQSIFSLLVHKYNVMYVPQIDQYCVENGMDTNYWQLVNRHGYRG
jgi:hypothetical protein